ncbi:MAG: sodium:alanine symporter family protein [Candidatus Syntrophonatronum acetioxidans]|uniref:Sodium:alanine symporter family protein n=1 Tax=Candidatus Syntrophonatronum acetioxidans TaxID=1795816 RepID=A0A424YH78_9FIRM|nr:MAG: sodium:alanine symporter family protein [Candidatus Syntrophonatronum acetioxidans]
MNAGIQEFFRIFTGLVDIVNQLVWGIPLILLILGTGIFLTYRTGFLPVVKSRSIIKTVVSGLIQKKGEGDISPFQALTTALAATVGTGNIAGVATAISLGGAGAMFWMWFSAFFGMVTKYSEIVLAVHFREKKKEGVAGGPMYFIQKGLQNRPLAWAFALFGSMAAFGIGNMVQANSVADAVGETMGIPPLVTGLILALLAGLVILGGIKRIGAITEKLVPFMAALYVFGALAILVFHRSLIPGALVSIFTLAFTGEAATAGFIGAGVREAVRFGVARGIFTNEAGLGSASIAHASARSEHPVQQGVWGVVEVFVDTLLICTLTALVILVTGALDSGLEGAALTAEAFNRGLPGYGGLVVSIGLVFFSFTTLLAWSFYGEKCFEFLFGTGASIRYRQLWIPFIVIGAVGGLRGIWILADTLNGLMALPNLIGLVGLSGLVVRLTREFFRD